MERIRDYDGFQSNQSVTPSLALGKGNNTVCTVKSCCWNAMWKNHDALCTWIQVWTTNSLMGDISWKLNFCGNYNASYSMIRYSYGTLGMAHYTEQTCTQENIQTACKNSTLNIWFLKLHEEQYSIKHHVFFSWLWYHILHQASLHCCSPCSIPRIQEVTLVLAWDDCPVVHCLTMNSEARLLKTARQLWHLHWTVQLTLPFPVPALHWIIWTFQINLSDWQLKGAP